MITKHAQPVGTVKALYRYPIKSMGGEQLARTNLQWHGFEGDRRFALWRRDDKSGFPWLTAGKMPSLVQYRAVYRLSDENRPTVEVTTPDGETFDGASVALRERLVQAYAGDFELMHLRHGMFDEAPLSLISGATLAALGQATAMELDVRRFRPNILLETASGLPFAEDAWVGSVLVFGSGPQGAAMSIAQRDLRCSMINLDPDTAVAEPRILRAVAQNHEACAGVYGATFRLGTISVGDPVYCVTPH